MHNHWTASISSLEALVPQEAYKLTPIMCRHHVDEQHATCNLIRWLVLCGLFKTE